MQGRKKDMNYTQEKLASFLSIHRDTLNNLKNKDEELHSILLTGAILKLEHKNEDKIPFYDMKNELNKEHKEITIKEEWLSYSFVDRDLLDYSITFINHFHINWKDLNSFIYFRNLKKLILENYYERVEDETEFSRELFY